MKTLISVIVAFLMALAGLFVFHKDNAEKTQSKFDYSSCTAVISFETPNGIKSIGYACIYAENSQSLQLLTAAHVVNDPKQDYFVTFHNGTTVKVSAVNILQKDADLALIEVPRKKLQNGKEYQIPQFDKLQNADAGKSLYVWGDEYENNPARMVDRVLEKNGVTEVYFNGSVAKGRSGSPVFLKDSNICVGVISGFFTKDSGVGENTVCLFL